MTDEFYENERAINLRRKKKQEFIENEAREKIKRKAKISIETTTIGALSDFESAFGYLWGHGRNYNSLNKEEKKMRECWMDTRLSILDRCNNSKKILLNSVDRCDIKNYDDRYVTIIKTENRNGR